MDILDLRLKFSEMNDLWKAWVLFLLVADIIAAIGLWKNTAWGVWTFLIVASSQIVAYTFFQDHFSKQTFLVGFHILTIGLYLVIKVRSTPSKPQL